MARNCAKQFDATLKLNTTKFQGDKLRRYSLCLWNVPEPIDNTSTGKIIRERGMPFNQSVLDTISNQLDAEHTCMLDGYWQTEKYLTHVTKQELGLIFQPGTAISDQAFQNLKLILNAGRSAVFVTIRRTDYTKTDYHGVLPPNYYVEASKIIAERVQNPQFFVFSDEPEWAKTQFRFPFPYTVCGNWNQTTPAHLGREDEELFLMRHCPNAIMANSSYSWWGAWLAETPNSVIVAPQKWFHNSPEDASDIVPERWTKI